MRVAVEYLPVPQSVHTAEPVLILYFPASQAEHVPPLGPVNPRLQTQFVGDVDAAADCVSGGQATARTPRTSRYV